MRSMTGTQCAMLSQCAMFFQNAAVRINTLLGTSLRSIACAMLCWCMATIAPSVTIADETPSSNVNNSALRFEQSRVTLNGQDARHQLLLSFGGDTGPVIDRTREAQFVCEPAGIVAIDAQGLVAPIQSGHAVIKATLPDGGTATTEVDVQSALTMRW